MYSSYDPAYVLDDFIISTRSYDDCNYFLLLQTESFVLAFLTEFRAGVASEYWVVNRDARYLPMICYPDSRGRVHECAGTLSTAYPLDLLAEKGDELLSLDPLSSTLWASDLLRGLTPVLDAARVALSGWETRAQRRMQWAEFSAGLKR